MSFTGKLGTSLSKLGNFKLGSIGGGGGPATYNDSISIDCTAAVARTLFDDYVASLTIAGIASTNENDGSPLFVSLSLQATASISSPGGVSYFNTSSIDGIASTSEIVGFAFSKSISIDATVSAAGDFVYKQNLSLSVDATASATVTHIFVAANTVIITSIGQAAPTSTEDYVVNLTLSSTARLFNENLYENLLDVLSIGTVTVTSGGLSLPSETPDAIAGVTVAAAAVFNRIVNQTFVVTQVAHRNPGLVPSVQTLSMVQSATYKMVHNQTVVQTLVYAQTAYRVYPVYQTLAYAQTAVGIRVHVQKVIQTFSMTQNATHSGTFARSIVQTYVPYQGGTKQLPIVGPGEPLTYFNPPVTVFKAPPKCYVILQSPSYSLTLPCPQLGDTQNYTGTINLKRTMTGDTFTYIRRSQINTLRYTFWLGRQKTLEVEDFVKNYGDEILSLFNWKGEHWKVNITSTPFEFIGKERYQPQGERYEVSFEFTGIKVGG
jgi:hypothetical protein